MKTFISYAVLAILLLASSSTIANQQQINEQVEMTASVTESCFDHLRVHRQGKAGVSISWGVSRAEIDHFIVERSYDGEFFEQANVIGFNGSATYKMNDNSVFAGTIHYRVTAVFQDGTMETSEVKSMRIVQRG